MTDRFQGVVLKGQKRGSELGYPTANIKLETKDVEGVFAALVSIHGESYRGAAFADPFRGILEVFLYDFSKELYGIEIEIELLEKIRSVEMFDSDEKLRQRIAGDILAISAYFDSRASL